MTKERIELEWKEKKKMVKKLDDENKPKEKN